MGPKGAHPTQTPEPCKSGGAGRLPARAPAGAPGLVESWDSGAGGQRGPAEPVLRSRDLPPAPSTMAGRRRWNSGGRSGTHELLVNINPERQTRFPSAGREGPEGAPRAHGREAFRGGAGDAPRPLGRPRSFLGARPGV